MECFTIGAADSADVSGVDILVVSRDMADAMTIVDDGTALIFAGAAVTQDDTDPSIANDGACVYETDGRIIMETTDPDIAVTTYPAGYLAMTRVMHTPSNATMQINVHRVSDTRHVIELPTELLTGDEVDDMRLRIRYNGDIGWLWCDGTLVDDNFANGDVWEIGLREYARRIADNRHQLVLIITPLKEGANVNVESAMAARKEDVASQTAELCSVELVPVYRTVLRRA